MSSWIKRSLGCLTTLIGIALAGDASAVPSLLTVQGQLENEGGPAADGAYDIKFSLWTAETGGTELWSGTQTVTLWRGVFDAVIGDEPAPNPPLNADIFKDNASVWMQIELEAGAGVAAAGDPPLPRRPLTGVAFAFAAHHADTATTATTAATATLATSAINATTAVSATTAQSALNVGCASGCVSVSELDFDPATQAELDAAKITSVNNLTGGSIRGDVTLVANGAQTGSLTVAGGVTVTGSYTSTSGNVTLTNGNVTLTNGTVVAKKLTQNGQDVCDRSGNCGASITSVNNLAGGTITSAVTVSGAVTATAFTQNGNVVCDDSGNCGSLTSVDGLAGGTIEGALTVNGGLTATTLDCTTACISTSELTFDPATQAELDAIAATTGNATNLSCTGCVAASEVAADVATQAELDAVAGTITGNATNLSCTGCVAASEVAADVATQAELDAARADALGLTCTGCVAASEVAADVATQAELDAVAATTGNATNLTCTGCVAASEVAADVATQAELDAARADALGLTCIGCVAASEVAADVATQAELDAVAGTITGNATNLNCTGCVAASEVAADVATQAELDAVAGTITGNATNLNCTGCVAASEVAADVATQAELDAARADALGLTCTGCVSASEVAADVATQAELDASKITSLAGLAGGNVTSAVSVTGNLSSTTQLSAPVIKQGANDVCDSSGNCGRTLPVCTQSNQVPTWNGSIWECKVASGGSTPTQPCTGRGEALQWNGTTWVCVNATSPSSNGQANGFEIVDDWGDAWDGVQRAPRTFAVAKAACEADGGRLPLASELWRNRSSVGGTGNLAQANDASYLWTLVPQSVTTQVYMVKLDDGDLNNADVTSSLAYRCIWPKHTGDAFTRSHCYGPPGSECRATADGMHNIDSYSRPPLIYAAALFECQFLNASIPTANDWQTLIQNGAGLTHDPVFNNADMDWHWVSQSYYYQSISHNLVRWDFAPQPWWGVTSGYLGSYGGPTGAYRFRCIGKQDRATGFLPTTPACQGGACFTLATRGKAKVIADANSRGPHRYSVAQQNCKAAGGRLPTVDELTSLIRAGLPNGGDFWHWLAEITYDTNWGNETARWSSTVANNTRWWYHAVITGNTDGQTGTWHNASDAVNVRYRCVWPETREQTFRSCLPSQVQMYDAGSGGYKCEAKVNGDSAGNANPGIQYVDHWGNAWDFSARPAATWAAADTTCRGIGGRLPVATELYRVRHGQTVAPNTLGTAETTSYLWTLNPDYRQDYYNAVALHNGTTTAYAKTATSPYRCVWPASKPELFSGHACYGPAAAPCLEVDRLRFDKFDRALLPQAAAAWECAYFGGHIPSIRELSEMIHGGAPNGTDSWNWTSEFSYHLGSNTYVHVGKWTTDGTSWEFNNTDGSWDADYTYRNFRCVFSDYVQ